MSDGNKTLLENEKINTKKKIKMKQNEAHEAMKKISDLLIHGIAVNGKNDLEKFLIQQNLIQYRLMELIVLRSGFPDKEFRGKIEKQTLGSLIEFYKICAIKTDDNDLLLLLKQYNIKRNYLVHKIMKDNNFIKAMDYARKANETGMKIIKIIVALINKKNVSDAILHELQNKN